MEINHVFTIRYDSIPNWESIFKAINDLIDSGYNAYQYNTPSKIEGFYYLIVSNNSGLTDEKLNIILENEFKLGHELNQMEECNNMLNSMYNHRLWDKSDQQDLYR